MICREKCIVMDIDGTLCPKKRPEEHYADLKPYEEMVQLLSEYKRNGFYIILASSRNMSTLRWQCGAHPS